MLTSDGFSAKLSADGLALGLTVQLSATGKTSRGSWYTQYWNVLFEVLHPKLGKLYRSLSRIWRARRFSRGWGDEAVSLG